MSVHERIKRFRESRGMTHQQFANAVGVSRGAVQQWEKGVTAPTRKNQPHVAKFMGITVAELMNATGQGTPDTLPALLPPPNTPPALAGRAGGAMEGVATQEQAVDLISAALTMMTDAQRETMAGKLASLARAPDSPTLKKSISESLGSAPLPPAPE